ncbi:hypothetical protein [Peribacillus simplex]|uniref:hypothetical protein n=1 Tax=Peribacillus simplex TaxID=1478 RepID=UPI002853393B|nr:hypothetical protein [Peribacillus simplex]MDR4927222.1 hypothetical protein [Peribacillus simplex]
MNGHLFWFSLIILIFSFTYYILVYRDQKALKKMSIEDYKKRFDLVPGSPYSTDKDFEASKNFVLDTYKSVSINTILVFSLGPCAALVISIFAESNIFLSLGHICNWFSIINLFYQNYHFKVYWKETVSKAITFTSIIFVPLAFYYIVLGGDKNSLATYVTIFGFPITLASILTFISKR